MEILYGEEDDREMKPFFKLLLPDAVIGEGLAINYSGGSEMPADVSAWLEQCGIERQ